MTFPKRLSTKLENRIASDALRKLSHSNDFINFTKVLLHEIPNLVICLESSNTNYSLLANFIKEQRHKRNMAQEYLASELGLSRPTYAQIEQGKRDLTISEARKIAAIFGMSLEGLLSNQESEQKVVIRKKSKKKLDNLQIRVTQKNLEW